MFDSTSRYKDRIQSCGDAPMNAYRQDPWAMQAHRAYHCKAKDSVETSQQRLERSIMEKFKNGDFTLRSGKIFLLAQLSKGVVVILFLPPFFFFVLAPKWAFQTLSPLLAKALELAGKESFRIFSRISAWTSDVFAFIQHRLFGKFKRKAKIVPKVKQVEKRLPSRTYKKMELLIRDFNAIWKSCSLFVRNSVIKAREALKGLASKTRLLAKLQLERLQRFSVSAVAKSLERLFKHVKSLALTFTEKMQAVEKRFAQQVFNILQPIRRAYLAMIQAVAAPIIQMSRTVASFVDEKINTPFHNVINRLQKVYQAVEMGFKSFVNAVLSRLPSLPSMPALPAMPTFNLAWIAARFVPIQKNLSEKAKKAASIIAQIFTRAAKDCLAKGRSLLLKAKKLVALAKEILQEALKFAKRAPGLLWKFLKGLFRKVARVLKRIFHAIRIGYTLTKVLLRYFWQELDKSLRMTQ